jgi:hypothetical protein
MPSRAEAEVHIDGRKMIKTIQDEFTKLYPYLGLFFFTQKEIKKSTQGESIRPISDELRMAQARTKESSTNSDFKVTPQMHVGTLERRFGEEFGLNIQVCIQKGDEMFYTSGKYDAMTLKKLNSFCEENGYSQWQYRR